MNNEIYEYLFMRTIFLSHYERLDEQKLNVRQDQINGINKITLFN